MERRAWHRWAGTLGLLALLSLVLVPAARAFEMRNAAEVIIGPDEVVTDDLYVSAEYFRLEGTIQGDLFVSGSRVEIDGTVEGDVMAMGQVVVLNGSVRDDVRLAGMALVLGEGAEIGSDLLVFGFELLVQPGSRVGQDALLSVSQALMAGEIGRNLEVDATGLDFQGQVSSDVWARVARPEDAPPFSPAAFIPGAPPMPRVAGGLTVGDGAQVGGTLAYSGPVEAAIPAGASIAAVDYQAPAASGAQPVPTSSQAAERLLGHLRRSATLLLVGLLSMWLVPGWIKGTAETARSRPLPSLGWGLLSVPLIGLALLVILLVTVLLATTFGIATLNGLMLAALWVGLLALLVVPTLFVLAAAYVTQVAASYLAGHLILSRRWPAAACGRLRPLLLGLLVFTTLTAIPVLNWLIYLLVVPLGLGALGLSAHTVLRQRSAGQATSA